MENDIGQIVKTIHEGYMSGLEKAMAPKHLTFPEWLDECRHLLCTVEEKELVMIFDDLKNKISCLVGYLEMWQNNKGLILERPSNLKEIIEEVNEFLEENNGS